tara:strand:- start:764 stop:1873 length:1110 start_codon:yes stop_codon:yes gene_type:complete
MLRILLSFCLSVPLLVSPASATPELPAGFDIGENSIRGGEIGEEVTLQITPYNAGRKLYESPLFSVYERINSLSSDYVTYGDPICSVSKPGEQYQYFSSIMVVVMNMGRDEPITRQLLWDEVRPVVSRLALEICPRAKGVNAHIFIKGWDVTGEGDVFMPEAVPLPRVQLRALTQSDVSNQFNFRNNRAVEVINALVSQGILSAYFAFGHGDNQDCTRDGSPGQACTYETFAPVYWGAPQKMEVFSLTGRSLSAGMASQREAMRRKRDQVMSEYEQRYTTFDGFAQGVAYRIERDERVRQSAVLRDKAMQAWYTALSEGMKRAEERGWGPSFFHWIGSNNGGSGNKTLCSARANSVMDSCTEDFLFLVN